MIIWISAYIPEWDGLVALPVDDNGPAKEAIQRGNIRLVSEPDATKINLLFRAQAPAADQWLNDLLATRKKMLGIDQ